MQTQITSSPDAQSDAAADAGADATNDAQPNAGANAGANALEDFASMAAERIKKKSTRPVTLRLPIECVSQYRKFGISYSAIMAEVLQYVVAHPDILSAARSAGDMIGMTSDSSPTTLKTPEETREKTP